jgi:hypothetical protein
MVATGNPRRLISLVCAAAFVLAGCDSLREGAAAPGTPGRPTLAPEVPAGFDPCKDIPQEVLDSEGLQNKIPDSSDLSSGLKRRGCMWVQLDGYAASIVTTNATLDIIRGQNFPEATEFVIGERRALSTRQQEEAADESCYVNVAMKDGSLEFGLTNSTSNRNTGHVDTCDLARSLAEKVVPAVPSGV